MPPKKKPYSQLSKSAKYYRKNKSARDAKKKTDSKINSRPSQKTKRAECGRKRYAAKKKGQDISKKDYDHSVGKFVSSKTNRGRKEKSRLKGSKRE